MTSIRSLELYKYNLWDNVIENTIIVNKYISPQLENLNSVKYMVFSAYYSSNFELCYINQESTSHTSVVYMKWWDG